MKPYIKQLKNLVYKPTITVNFIEVKKKLCFAIEHCLFSRSLFYIKNDTLILTEMIEEDTPCALLYSYTCKVDDFLIKPIDISTNHPTIEIKDGNLQLQRTPTPESTMARTLYEFYYHADTQNQEIRDDTAKELAIQTIEESKKLEDLLKTVNQLNKQKIIEELKYL